MPLILADAMRLVQDRFLVPFAGTHVVAGAMSFCCNRSPVVVQLDDSDTHTDLDALVMHHLPKMHLPAFVALQLTRVLAAQMVYGVP